VAIGKSCRLIEDVLETLQRASGHFAPDARVSQFVLNRSAGADAVQLKTSSHRLLSATQRELMARDVLRDQGLREKASGGD